MKTESYICRGTKCESVNNWNAKALIFSLSISFSFFIFIFFPSQSGCLSALFVALSLSRSLTFPFTFHFLSIPFVFSEHFLMRFHFNGIHRIVLTHTHTYRQSYGLNKGCNFQYVERTRGVKKAQALRRQCFYRNNIHFIHYNIFNID